MLGGSLYLRYWQHPKGGTIGQQGIKVKLALEDTVAVAQKCRLYRGGTCASKRLCDCSKGPIPSVRKNSYCGQQNMQRLIPPMCRDEVSQLQIALHAAKEDAMNMRNAADKRSAMEKEIAGLQSFNMQLGHESMEASQSIDPLKAKREQLSRYIIGLAISCSQNQGTYIPFRSPCKGSAVCVLHRSQCSLLSQGQDCTAV